MLFRLVSPVTSSVEVISTPAAPFKVNAPALVVILDAAAASNEIPALASTVISAPLSDVVVLAAEP